MKKIIIILTIIIMLSSLTYAARELDCNIDDCTDLVSHWKFDNSDLGDDLDSSDTGLWSGLVALWHFDEGTGQYLNDSSGNGNNGTLKPSYPTNGPQWTEGKMGKALEFEGGGDYVEIPSSNSLNLTSAITIEVWINQKSKLNNPRIVHKSCW